MEISPRQVMQMAREEARKGSASPLAKQFERHRRQGFGWRYDGLGDWETEAIFAKLQELGVDTDAARFRAQAESAGRPSELSEQWQPPSSRGDFWDDFPMIAAEELWARLTPDLSSPELVAARIDPVIQAASASRQQATATEPAEQISAAMVLMDYLESFPPEERGERYEELSECTNWDYEEWLMELVCNRGKEYPDEATRIAEIMSGFALNATGFREDIAEVLGRAGRREEALRRIRENLERLPDEVQTHIRAGDAYEVMGDLDEALKEFGVAADMARDAGDWRWAVDRADWLLEKAGRTPEREEFARRHPSPVPLPETPAPAEPAPVAPKAPPKPAAKKASQPAAAAPPKPAEEPRGHAPCPCGSGRKYRNCCRPPR